MIVSAEDCILGDWEEWGECSAQCGKEGYKTRHRKIIQQQKFAGAECGPTTQKTYCIGTECRERRFGLGGTKQEISGEFIFVRNQNLMYVATSRTVQVYSNALHTSKH